MAPNSIFKSVPNCVCEYCNAPAIELKLLQMEFKCGSIFVMNQYLYRSPTCILSQKEKPPMIMIIDKRKETPLKGTPLSDIPWGTVFSGRIGSHHGIWLATALGVVQFKDAGSSSFPTQENKKAGTECINYKAHIASLTIE